MDLATLRETFRDLLSSPSGKQSPSSVNLRVQYNSTDRLEFPLGALTELSGAPGSGKTELLIQLLAQNPAIKAAWLEEPLTVYPVAFAEQGVSLERVLFIRAGEEGLWCARQVLQSQVFPLVVLSFPIREEMELRRLQLAAEKSGAALVILQEEPLSIRAWPIRARWSVQRTLLGSWKIQPLKRRLE